MAADDAVCILTPSNPLQTGLVGLVSFHCAPYSLDCLQYRSARRNQPSADATASLSLTAMSEEEEEDPPPSASPALVSGRTGSDPGKPCVVVVICRGLLPVAGVVLRCRASFVFPLRAWSVVTRFSPGVLAEGQLTEQLLPVCATPALPNGVWMTRPIRAVPSGSFSHLAPFASCCRREPPVGSAALAPS